MYNVDQILDPREELLWKGTRVYGVVTCSFVKHASRTIIALETEEKVRIQQRYRAEDFFRGVARLFIPKSHLARTVHQVHDHVELEVKRNGGNCDH
jgi:hypothetical protein